MNPTCLADVVCPAKPSAEACGGGLTLVDGSLPVRVSPDGDDVTEGLMHCETCGTDYPILGGVGIVVPNVESYLAARATDVSSALAPFPPSKEAVDYLFGQARSLYDRGYQTPLGESLSDVQTYLCLQYGRLTDVLPDDHPLYELAARSEQGGNLYDRALAMSTTDDPRCDRALDIGCNVGGMAWRLATHWRFVYGVDLSFRAVLTARRVLLHLPEPVQSFRLVEEGLRYTERPIDVERHRHVEFMVASATDLPFRTGFFDASVSLNVLELTEPQQLLSQALRVVRAGGIMTLSDPYGWGLRLPVERWIGSRPVQPSREALRALLSQSCEILSDVDPVVWILRGYDRMYAVWLCNVMVSRKRG